MTTPRDTLADLIEAAIDSVHDIDVTHRDYAVAAADAVLANFPGLVWDREAYHLQENATATALSPFGRYFVNDYSYWGPGVIVSTGYGNEATAKAAAEADHLARLAQAMGWA